MVSQEAPPVQRIFSEENPTGPTGYGKDGLLPGGSELGKRPRDLTVIQVVFSLAQAPTVPGAFGLPVSVPF